MRAKETEEQVDEFDPYDVKCHIKLQYECYIFYFQ